MMKDVVVHSAIIVEVVDNPGTKRDRVSIEFSAQANDLLVGEGQQDGCFLLLQMNHL